MGIKFHLEKITFSGGHTVKLSSNSILVIVGPNNCGKSTALRELQDACRSQYGGKVISTAKVQKSGEPEEAIKWFEKHTRVLNGNFSHVATAISRADILSKWDGPRLVEFANFFVTLSNTEQRLQAGSPQNRLAPGSQFGNSLHLLDEDDTAELRLSNFFSSAFNTDLILNRDAGPQIHFHCGKRSIFHASGLDLTHRESRDKLPQLPLLHEQGDGMRSFVGSILDLLTSSGFIHLIDEPEAFLHPPQARIQGKVIAELAKSQEHDRQIIIATHSGDFLRGLIEAAPDNLHVARLTRIVSVTRTTSGFSQPKTLKDSGMTPCFVSRTSLMRCFTKRVLSAKMMPTADSTRLSLKKPALRSPAQIRCT